MELATAEEEPALMPNWVEYWYWPVTESMISRPKPVGPSEVPNSAEGVQTKEPELGMPSARGAPTWTTLLEGPLRKRIAMGLDVLGVQVIVKGVPAVTTYEM